jgi:hypothetical protein
MNTMKNVMAKVAKIENEKVELAAERVELGLAQDMVGYATRIGKASLNIAEMEKNIAALRQEYLILNNEAGKRASTILRLQTATEQAYNINKKQYANVAKNATNTMQQFEAAAKQMGLKPDSSAEYKKLAKAMEGNAFKSIQNIDNKNYFFNSTESAKTQLMSVLAKIK